MQVGEGNALRRCLIKAEGLAKDIDFKGALRQGRAGDEDSGGAGNCASECAVVHQILSGTRRANRPHA